MTSFDNTLALPGLGDSENLVLFYEDGRLEDRIAYNNREQFFAQFGGAPGEPEFTRKRSQVDVRAAWHISKTRQLFIEGINVTDEVSSSRGRFNNQFISMEQTGARYSVGIRASF